MLFKPPQSQVMKHVDTNVLGFFFPSIFFFRKYFHSFNTKDRSIFKFLAAIILGVKYKILKKNFGSLHYTLELALMMKKTI